MIPKSRAVLIAWLGCLSPCPVFGQTPPPAPRLAVSPPDGSILVIRTTFPVFVTIGNFDAFTNVTVTGSFLGQPNLAFLDDGQPPDLAAGDGIFSADLVTPGTPVSDAILDLVVSAEVPPPDPLPDPPPPPEIVTTTAAIRYIVVSGPGNDDFTDAFKIAPA